VTDARIGAQEASLREGLDALCMRLRDLAGDVAVLDQSGPRRFRMGLTLEF